MLLHEREVPLPCWGWGRPAEMGEQPSEGT